MAEDLDGFERACKATAMQLRRIPKDLRKALSDRVKPDVAEPLAARIGSAWSGTWSAQLSGATKARAGADPTIVVGGAKAVVSGGANARQLVYGVEFGANPATMHTVNRQRSATPGNRMSGRGRVTAKERAAAAKVGAVIFKRHATRQFTGRKAPALFPTIRDSGAWIMDKYADIVDDVLGGVSDGR